MRARWWGWLLALMAIVMAIGAPSWYLRQHPTDETEVLLEQQQLQVRQPRFEVVSSIPDFNEYSDTRDKKQAFFQFLAPLVQAENAIIEEQRIDLLAIYERWQQQPTQLSDDDREFLQQLAAQYRAPFDVRPESQMFALLLRRVDVVPETLVLVQAANESGWGTSRFARDGLNFFGQWCFSDGCGLVPEDRPEGMSHEVRRFQSVNASIRAYLRNINTHPAYVELRLLREQRRAEGLDIRALDLTPGLLAYSERGEAYIEELNAMIRVNRPIILEVMEVEQAPIEDPEAPPQ